MSDAPNLVPGDTNVDIDIFLRDTVAGTTTRVSVDSAEAEADDDSFDADISANGRYVSFRSFATNLVPGDTNGVPGTRAGDDVFVRDTVAGTTVRADVDSNEAQVAGLSYAPVISANGRYVAFLSQATDLVAGDTNGAADVFVRDLQAGTTSRVSLDSNEAQQNNASIGVAISGDGRYIAFESAASNLIAGDTNGGIDVFVRDRVAGTTRRVSVDRIGAQASQQSTGVAISVDGRYVAFDSFSADLVNGDTNSNQDVFVRANPEPIVSSITPAALARGTTTPVTVTGSGFVVGDQLIIDGGGVTVDNVSVVSPTQITADVTVAGDARSSARRVFVALEGTGQGRIAGSLGLCNGCVTVD